MKTRRVTRVSRLVSIHADQTDDQSKVLRLRR